MTLRTAAATAVISFLFALPCLAQHDPQVIFEGKPPDKSTWWAFRITPSLEMEEYYFSTEYEGTFAGIFDTSHGDVLYYSLNILSEEQKETLAGGNCIIPDDPLLVDGDKYFISRWSDIGTLYVGQIEEGEKWLFRAGDTLYFKDTPLTWGELPVSITVELLDNQLRAFNSIEYSLFPWQLAEARTSSPEGELETIIRVIGAASSEEEFGDVELPEGIRWLVVPLDNGMGTVKAWSTTEIYTWNIMVAGVKNQSAAIEPEEQAELPQYPTIKLEDED